MSDKQLYVLASDGPRARAVRAVQEAPAGQVVTIRPATRSLEQSAKFHAMCGDLAKQLPYAGKLRTLEQWKQLIVSAHSVATKEPTDIVPGIEGEFLNLRESTAKMSIGRMASLIEYAYAYGAMKNVRWSG